MKSIAEKWPCTRIKSGEGRVKTVSAIYVHQSKNSRKSRAHELATFKNKPQAAVTKDAKTNRKVHRCHSTLVRPFPKQKKGYCRHRARLPSGKQERVRRLGKHEWNCFHSIRLLSRDEGALLVCIRSVSRLKFGPRRRSR